MIDNLLSWFTELFSLFALLVVFFTVWAVVSGGVFAVMVPLHRRLCIPEWLDKGIVLLGAVAAIVIVVWLNCALFVEAPWWYAGCRALGVRP